MLRKLFALLLLPLGAFAADRVGVYSLYQEASLSTAVQKVTVQQIASGTRDIQFINATIWCSAATTFTLSINGTAATATTSTPTPIFGPASTATGWTASDVGTGTVVGKWDWQANEIPQVIDLSSYKILRSAGTTGNLTLATTSITATCRIWILFSESK